MAAVRWVLPVVVVLVGVGAVPAGPADAPPSIACAGPVCQLCQVAADLADRAGSPVYCIA